MGKQNGTESSNEVVTERVTVSQNGYNLRVGIKAPKFSLGNNFLTLCITIGAAAECLLIYLMIKSSINLTILVPGCLMLAAGLGYGFVKLWLWHNFGEELINIQSNSFAMNRNYGLFKNKIQQRILDGDSELYTNRNDQWSWTEFRGKGIFRLSTTDAELIDFGLQLSDEEFAMMIGLISAQLDKFKEQPDEPEFSESADIVIDPVAGPATEPTLEPVMERATEPASEPDTEADTEPATEPVMEPATEPVLEPAAEPRTEPAEEPAMEPAIEDTSENLGEAATAAELHPPSLAQQTEGKHQTALNEYLEKAAGEVTVQKSTKSKVE